MNRLGVFAKHWTPGQVKTRLKAVGIDSASQVYLLILKHVLSRLQDVPCRKSIVYTPIERREEFSGIVPDGWSLSAQSSGGLGDRLIAFFSEQFQQGQAENLNDQGRSELKLASEQEIGLQYPYVIVIGSDCPSINNEIIMEAFRRLQKFPMVIGPSQDGGYYLIGLNQPHWELFQGIDWSTDRVFFQTTEAARKLGIEFGVLPELSDIDTPQDLAEYIRRLSRSETLDTDERQLFDGLKLLAGLESFGPKLS